MNKRGILLNKIKELKKTRVDNKDIIIGYSTGDGDFYGSIWIDKNINPVKFAYLFNENKFVFLDEFAPVDNEWVESNVESKLYELLNLELELDNLNNFY